MKAVIQKVKKAKVTIEGKTTSEIGAGLLVLLAVSSTDDISVIKWMANKIVNLRIFPDNQDKMNLSALNTGADIMIISNFTVYGDVHKGFRPNFMKSAPASVSEPIYNQMVNYLKENSSLKIEEGKFGAMMDIELINEGPVTVIIEKENEND